MAEIISMKKARERQDRLDHDWGLEIVRKKRKALMRTVPIMSDEITKLDTWLVEQPIPIKELIQIWARANYCLWVMYGDLSPEQKHFFLLLLRQHYWEFQNLPPRWQKKLSPAWENWAVEFADEEIEEAANGAA